MSTINSTADHSLDATLDALSHSTRRFVLRYLGRGSTDARVSTETLASAVAAWRTGDESSEVAPDARQCAHVSLRHVHLPRLESAGLVERTRESESEVAASGAPETEYVEATTDGTPVENFFAAGLVEEFAECDRP